MENYSGKKFKIKETSTHKQFQKFGGEIIEIEDLWNELAGKGWNESCDQGNPAAIIYMLRTIDNKLPLDNDVLYGKTKDGFGHLVHISELEEIK